MPNDEKRIEIDNRFDHIYDLFNKKRYYRYGYTAFPFAVDNFQFHAQLNGCVVRPKIDRTGHTTDSYTSVREWSSVGNDQFTVALIQLDGNLTEFGKIHDNKRECGLPAASSHIYAYLFTDWLQMHTNGGSAICPRFRFAITSGPGDWHKLGVTKLARRLTQPVVSTAIAPKQNLKTNLPADRYSFLKCNADNVRLLTLKLAEEPGGGIIARLLETEGLSVTATLNGITQNASMTLCSVTERDRRSLKRPIIDVTSFGYNTLRLKFPNAFPGKCVPNVFVETDSRIALKWSKVSGAVQYNVYQGDFAEFVPDVYHLVATVTTPEYNSVYFGPGEKYFYRVAAVDSDLNQGPISELVKAETTGSGHSAPAPIGYVITGLVTKPRAVSGDEFDQLYLEWGQNRESDLDHYELVRGETPDFKPQPSRHIANVEPGLWRIVRYEDRGLKTFTRYYYRVRAVDQEGNCGPWSDVFSAVTREPYKECP